jgi:hypothetical protein
MSIISTLTRPWGLYAACAVAVAATLAAGVQTVRLAWSETAALRKDQAAAQAYDALAWQYADAEVALFKINQERADEFTKLHQRVESYAARPGSDAVCLDADGLRIVADLARGKATDTGQPAATLPAYPASASKRQ